jgi:hypothetical protein
MVQRHISLSVVWIVQRILYNLRMAANACYLIFDSCTFCSWFRQCNSVVLRHSENSGVMLPKSRAEGTRVRPNSRNKFHSWVGLGHILFLLGFVVVIWLITLHTTHVCHAWWWSMFFISFENGWRLKKGYVRWFQQWHSGALWCMG